MLKLPWIGEWWFGHMKIIDSPVLLSVEIDQGRPGGERRLYSALLAIPNDLLEWLEFANVWIKLDPCFYVLVVADESDWKHWEEGRSFRLHENRI
jgi:hypothetical protein